MSFHYVLVLLGSWHSDIGATSKVDKVLYVKNKEHVELPLVLNHDVISYY